MEILNTNRLAHAKRAYSTRHIDLNACTALTDRQYRPASGDLVLARVVSIGSHQRIELPSGRKSLLQPGDEILLAYGSRYAPDQYEAYVPETLERCHMVAAGGIAALATSWHDKLSGPTVIEPVGVVCGAHARPVNLKHYRAAKLTSPPPAAVFGVFGTSMNAGKTTVAASLVKGFSDAGIRVGALKVTGTAAGGDPWLMRDCGASEVLDFTDAGFATTYLEPVSEIVCGAQNLLRHLGKAGCEVAIVEVADGLYQEETAELAQHPLIQSLFNGVFFAAGDALGAVTGASILKRLGHTVLGVSGAVMRSPLAAREAANRLDCGVLSLDQLKDPSFAKWLVQDVTADRPHAAGDA